MKNLKIFSIISIFIAIVLIASGYSILFIDEYSCDAEKTSSYASLIKSTYKSYTADIENITFEINKTTIFDVSYYAEIRLNHNNNISELDMIEEHIKKVENTSKQLLSECKARDYNDYDIDNKCETIIYNYESIINAYVSIVNKYNERIDNYNAWDKNNNLTKYEPKYYKDYVDINEDGEYLGML